ncbi:hypothetical protein PHLGIDRAFT_232840 [Phlebiopsis gigantea 11061_1 CR5-6]|uniref:Protein kinase domain-containing protein n=1 Tax=Phlebiopsis gigantea (strain 11061_1 CR5-6) TaxID=745531 RepID=A0A0C3SEI1_PHLG1|nr:hypothetical protein PHLGIDRAFT_232840 [Phlebiopsis gigantea 11061_1 CR5-6]
MSCRPFQLFSIGVLIFASSFTVSVYDRGGVLHSCQMQVYDSHGLTDDFIRVVRLLSFDAGEIDLGRDPTVTAVGATKSEEYPRYNIKQSSPLPHIPSPQRTTIGRPIWTSHSLLGRGTSVWRVHSHNAPQDEQIMKTAWRHEDCDGEAEVYSYLDECKITGSPGIAAFRSGQDISFVPAGSLREVVLSVNSLRPREARLPKDIILHRVVLTSIGKPLWEYDTPAQFIRALLAIVQGIRTLEQHDILHRDISAGNVLLATNSRPGYEAFLTDFEFAKIPSRPKPTAIPTSRWHITHMVNERKVHNQSVIEHISWSNGISHASGPEMTGTLQFMAIDMLDNCTTYTHGVGCPPTYEPVKRAVRHELESLVWVAEYALFRKAHQAVAHLSSSHADRKEVETAFAEEFGCNVPSRLVKQRRQTAILPRAPHGPQQKITPYLDEPLRQLIPALMGIVKSQNDHQDLDSGQFWSAERVEYEQRAPMPMTCDSLEGVLRKYASVMRIF